MKTKYKKIIIILIIIIGIPAAFFILDDLLLHGSLNVITAFVINEITNPGDLTAHEIVVEKNWGKKHFLYSITGPRNPSTEKVIVHATETKDPLLCDVFTDFEYNRCTFEVALSLIDKSLCKDVGSSLWIFDPETCKATIDGIVNQDANECEKIENHGREICYQDLARILKDPSICDRFSGNHRCYWNLAVSLEREDLCELAPFNQACVAIANRDSSSCETITEEIERSKCFYNIAILTGDSGICSRLDDEFSTSVCTQHVNTCVQTNYNCTFLAQRYT